MQPRHCEIDDPSSFSFLLEGKVKAECPYHADPGAERDRDHQGGLGLTTTTNCTLISHELTDRAAQLCESRRSTHPLRAPLSLHNSAFHHQPHPALLMQLGVFPVPHLHNTHAERSALNHLDFTYSNDESNDLPQEIQAGCGFFHLRSSRDWASAWSLRNK